MQAGEATDLCKETSMGSSGGSLEDKNASRNVDRNEVSSGNVDLLGNWTRGH
jgi:hypothetical protein